ncbi:MAG: methionine--tRNA ligase [Candidatus Njordarchaeia archaeon]
MANFKGNKTWIITAALPYANGELHIGHIRSTYLPVDVFTRHIKAIGIEAYSVCGTDEHGTPILVRALEEKVNPKVIVDRYHKIIRESLERTNIIFDIFSRTTREHHYALTQEIYRRIKSNGYIYRKKVKSFYCERDKISLPDRLVRGTCPYCGAPNQYGDHCEVCGRTYSPFQLKDPRCAICGEQPIIIEREHTFFALSEFSKKLERWIKEEVKLTKGVREHVLKWIKEGLHDWDLSRNINWGVPIPDSKDQVFYVWFDAPIGYISFTKELFEKLGKDWEPIWMDDKGYIVHFIGKDIIYHHVLFWPAMLMAAEFSLPKEIRVRGFATLEGQKMSKSRRWYIGLNDFVDIWNPDYLRFYWSLTTPESLDDGDFSLREFSEKINKVLIGEIGNFIHRTLTLIKRGGITDGNIMDEIKKFALETLNSYNEDMLNNRLDKGLKDVIDLSSHGNKLLSEYEPWRDLSNRDNQDLLVSLFAISIQIGAMLEPFLPGTIVKLFKLVEVPSNRNLNKLVDELFHEKVKLKYLLQNVVKSKKVKPLFSKVTPQEIEKAKKFLGGKHNEN